MIISERIFYIMEQKNMSQLELSRRTGIATSNISDWKKKKTNPKADCLISICDALDITPEQLLTGKGIDPEYKDTDMDYEVTRSDIKILKQIHSLGDEQYKRLMAYMKNLYVTTPIGADIFKVAGGGQNYVHGGSSLQEMLIPVIELTMNTRAVAYDYVDVILTSVNRKVTNLITFFDFIQTEKVTDTMKARSLVAYFTTEDGEKISFDVPIVANIREDAPEKRTFHEKFTLKSREYKYGDKYYLVLADANDEKNILQQYEFMIDIAFVDDFGF